MSAKRKSTCRRDYISSLPDDVLGKILSLLSTNRVVCTSVLSKRWKNLFTLVDNVEVNDEDIGLDEQCFGEFVEKTLALLRKSPSIKRFSLSLSIDYGHDPNQVCLWIRSALELGIGCLELYLDIMYVRKQPDLFLRSNTLVELTIRAWHTDLHILTPGTMIFPALEKLSLISVVFDGYKQYHSFLSGFPLLEELFLHYDHSEDANQWNRPTTCITDVASPSIKRLTIFSHFPNFDFDLNDHIGGGFMTPSFEYLEYTGCIDPFYKVDFASLVEARLDIRLGEIPIAISFFIGAADDDYYAYLADMYLDDAMVLFKGISNVKTLHLSAYSLQVFHVTRTALPIFPNLLTLSFESDKERGWQVVPLLIENSPNLETLVIKGLVHKVTDMWRLLHLHL